MNIRNFYSALTLATILFSVSSCVKEEAPIKNPVDDGVAIAPAIPEGSSISIHFGTATQRGCLYSFSNCIWIGWGTQAINQDARMALQFEQGDDAGQYFGQYFPLTADYVVNQAEAAELNIEPQVIPAGFYPIRDVSSGQASGKRTVILDPLVGHQTGTLVNTNNPQDNLGQLHNLAVQVVLHENRHEIQALGGDKLAIQKLLSGKLIKFMVDAGLSIPSTDQKRAYELDLDQDFGDYTARLAESQLSLKDQSILLEVFKLAANTPVSSEKELQNFVNMMTEQENRLANDQQVENRKVVLSMVSTLKYSRYFWYWKSVTSTDAGNGGTVASTIPDWVWADVIALEIGGPVASAVASALVYLDTH